MSYEIKTYPTEKKAILAARQSAAEFAAQNETDSEEKVLLDSGDTLVVTATMLGNISEKISGGHIMSGHLFCSEKLAEKI